jgi:hypothetical protein
MARLGVDPLTQSQVPNQNLVHQPSILNQDLRPHTISEVVIPKIFSNLNAVQGFLQKISNETIEQLIAWILRQSISDIYQIIQFLIIFHRFRPHQSDSISFRRLQQEAQGRGRIPGES